MASQGRIKLRTKVSESNVLPEEIEQRELVFGNYEKLLYIKDQDGEVGKFGRMMDGVTNAYSVWSSEKTRTEIDSASSDSSRHNHDTRYYLISQVDAMMAQKADSIHSHNDLYYTKVITDTLLGSKIDKVIGAVSGNIPIFDAVGNLLDSGFKMSELITSLGADFVHITGNENISGVKTFLNLPVIPTITPSLDGHVASKYYLDSKLQTIDGGLF